MKLDYCYSWQKLELFSFYQFPKFLIKDNKLKHLSNSAKILYSLMLDRTSLSIKNGWVDDKNRIFIIYTVENAMVDLGCSKSTCLKIIKELDVENGVGLIERKRTSQGKPNIFYVKCFFPEKGEGENFNPNECKKYTSTGTKVIPIWCEKCTPTGIENIPLQVQKIHSNNTNINNTKISNTNLIESIYSQEQGKIDSIEEMLKNVKKNLDIKQRMLYDKLENKEIYEALYNIICNTIKSTKKTIRIASSEVPTELVREKFLKLTSSHLEYVIYCMQNTTTEIKNIKAYMLTALYNAPDTMPLYYQQKVRHDMY